MVARYVIWAAVALTGLGLVGFGIWIASRPAPAAFEAKPVPQLETDTLLAALRPPKRTRPLIAVVGINDATEATDYLMPYGILKRADVADVVLLATQPGRVKLYPALTVEAEATTADFDREHPAGADYVIVPAMSRDDDPAALGWIRNQAANGAIIISVCAGAKVTGAAGLLEGKQSTTHWYYLGGLRERSPRAIYVPDRRYVADHGVMTTTGITASMPAMLALVEAIAGRDKAAATARDLGVTTWDARHDSGAFKLTRPFAATVLGNVLAFWNRERLGVPLSPGMDEVSLALVADAWSRTYRSQALTVASSGETVVTRSGARVVPDRIAADWEGPRIGPPGGMPPAAALEGALKAIGARYGAATAGVVAMQLEYPPGIVR